MLKKTVLFLFIGIQTIAFSQTKLASFFSDHMVLQQNEKVSLWGKDKPKKKVTITASWGETETIKADKNGEWTLKIQTPKVWFLSILKTLRLLLFPFRIAS